MRLNETKTKNKRDLQEEELEALWNQMELQNHLKKKKNWDAWMDGEVEAQIEEEIQEYLAASSDPTVYLNRKEAKAWNRMPKSKQKRLLQKDPNRYSKSGRQGSERSSLATNGIRRIPWKIWSFCSQGLPFGNAEIRKDGTERDLETRRSVRNAGTIQRQCISPVRSDAEFIQTGESWQGRKPEF